MPIINKEVIINLELPVGRPMILPFASTSIATMQ